MLGMDKLLMRVRPHVEADLVAIMNDWSASYRREMPEYLPEDIYRAGMGARMARLLNKGRVLVACDPVRPGRIFGWIVFETAREGVLTVHYAYTRYAFRRCGVADALFTAAGGKREKLTLCSHKTMRFAPLARKADLVHDESRLI